MKALIYTVESRQYRAEEMGIAEFRKAVERNRFCIERVTECPETMDKKVFRISDKKRAILFYNAFIAGGFKVRLVDTHDTSTRCGHTRYSVVVFNPGLDVVDFLNKYEKIFRNV